MANENLPAVIKFKAPKLQEVVEKSEIAFKNDEFKTYLNQDAPKKWLKEHPTATKKKRLPNGSIQEVPAEFLPIDKHEILLDTIFQQWKVEVLQVGIMFHSIYCTVRVHYLNPITHEWMFHDGVGAVKAQSDAKKEFSADTIKASAVQIGLPAAKSYAIKDATEHLGKLFGRDINRADTMAFEGAYNKEEPKEKTKEEERLEMLIENCKTKEKLIQLYPSLKTSAQRSAYDKKYAELNNK